MFTLPALFALGQLTLLNPSCGLKLLNKIQQQIIADDLFFFCFDAISHSSYLPSHLTKTPCHKSYKRLIDYRLSN